MTLGLDDGWLDGTADTDGLNEGSKLGRKDLLGLVDGVPEGIVDDEGDSLMRVG